jgi:hypothetical protein
LYVFVRTDLPLPQQVIQAIHAAYESAGMFDDNTSTTHSLVLCQIKSEKDLIKTSNRLDYYGIQHHIFKEPDIQNQQTALCTEPVTQDQRSLFSKYKLWKGELK